MYEINDWSFRLRSQRKIWRKWPIKFILMLRLVESPLVMLYTVTFLFVKLKDLLCWKKIMGILLWYCRSFLLWVMGIKSCEIWGYNVVRGTVIMVVMILFNLYDLSSFRSNCDGSVWEGSSKNRRYDCVLYVLITLD